MILGRVVGRITSTIHHRAVENQRLLIIDRFDSASKPDAYLIAMDAVGAGWGETVLVLDEGNGARQVTGIPDAPIRAVIVGVIDEVDLG